MMPQPKWLYKKTNIKNLDIISDELKTALSTFLGPLDSIDPNFVYIKKEEIIDQLPQTVKFLKSQNLLERWSYIGVITGNRGSSLPIHVDSLDFDHRCFALNIPVLNCSDTYTVFYDARILQPVFNDTKDLRSSSLLCDQNTAVELDRIELNQSYWINITIPHRPEMGHTFPRILASFRFSPEVHDLFLNEIFE